MLWILKRNCVGYSFTVGYESSSLGRRPKKEAGQELVPDAIKIKAFISGMKQTNYFWPTSGTVKILCGVLLISQYLELLGAVMLVPVTPNIFLFHLFLGSHEWGELVMTGLFYLLGNLLIIAYHYPKLKITFLNF